MQKLIVIGGGAAGYFGAITAASCFPEAEVLLLEKNRTVLNKVRISGGGRCNVTHACFDNKQLSKFYPRGGSFLKPLLNQFGVRETIEWFDKQQVKLKTEADGRMFPTTDSSETIAWALEEISRKVGVKVKTSTGVKRILTDSNKIVGVEIFDGEIIEASAVLVTTGGSPNLDGYAWLAEHGHGIVPPVPSLFTFNVPDSSFKDLAGVSQQQAIVRVAGKKHLLQDGPLLITHWGFSAPAVLKLSAWGARELAEMNYNFTAMINWVPETSEPKMRESFSDFKRNNPKKQVSSHPMLGVSARLWKRFCELAEIEENRVWLDISNKQLNKIIELLINTTQKVSGKTTFKEEFVTCGGVDLTSINPNTMESMHVKGLFFAGEVLDIDAVTGGFNFQAAWTTSYIAGKNIF